MDHFGNPHGGNGNANGVGSGGGRQATLREFSAILFRRKWIVLGLFAATTLTVLAIAFSTPVTYVSSGSVYVKRGERESILTAGRRVLDDWEQALGTEMEMVTSEPVLERARAILESDPETAGMIIDPGSIDAEVKGKSNVMAIGYISGNPVVAEKVCAALIRAYVEFRERDFTPSFPREFFEGEMAQVKADLEHWTSLRREFANQSGVIDVDEQNRQWISQIAQLEARRSEAAADLAEAEAVEGQIRTLAGSPDLDLAAFSTLFANDASLRDLERRVIDQQTRLATLRERLREDAVDVVNARKTLESLQEILARELEGRVKLSTARVEQLRARVEVLDRDIGAIQADLRTMPDKENRLAAMDREIKILTGREAELAEKSSQAKVTENTTSSINVMLLESAGPARVINARDPVRLALAPVFSLIVGIGLAFFIDSLDLTVRTARHAEEAAELPVLATLTNRRRRSTS